MDPIVKVILVAGIVAIGLRIFLLILDHKSSSMFRRNIAAMNRQAAKYEISGWMVLIDINKRMVGLYEDGHSISHDSIHVGKDVIEEVKSYEADHKDFVIGDFRTLDVDISRRSYRVLYEYQVPHSTPVIFY